MRHGRLLNLVAAVAILGLASCTTSTYRCSGGTCTVNLSGSGASTDLGMPFGTVTLEGAGDGVARFSVGAAVAECTEGQTVTVGGFNATCTEVGRNSLTVQLG